MVAKPFIPFLQSDGQLQLKLSPKYSLIEASINMYNCLRIRLTNNISITNKQFDNSYLQAGDFNEEYDQLWEEAIRSLPIQCSVVKCAKWHKWKTSDIYFSRCGGKPIIN